MSKYLKKKGAPIFLRILKVVLISLLACSALLLAFYLSKLDRITYADEVEQMYAAQETEDAIPTELSGATIEPVVSADNEEEYQVAVDDLEFIENPEVPEGEVQQSNAVFNILLIGTDERTTKYNKNARADSMILVSIDKNNHTVKLVSLERGIGVPILEGEYEGQYDLLTHVFRWGGADLLVKTVEHCFKIDVNHYVRVNFAAVKKIVDAVGGIDIVLTKKEAEGLNLWALEGDDLVKTGENRMDGNTALRYARLRWIDSDWQRVGRQRKVILAVVDEVKDASLIKINNLADEVLPLVQTNLTKMEITELLLYAPNFLRSEFDQMTIPKKGTYGGMSIRNGGGAFAVDYTINNDLLYRFLYEGVSSEELLAE